MSATIPGFPDVPARNWIDGRWVTADSGGVLAVVDPADEQHIADVPAGGVGDILAAVDAAETARRRWADRPPRERGEILRRAFDLMVVEAERFAHLIVRENGKALADARGEVTYAAEFFRWFAEEAVRLEGTLATAPSGRHRIMTELQPVGVSLLITPWNFPAAMVTRKIAPALAAGCPVVVKPPSETPLTALALADLLTRAGVPAGVVNVVVVEDADPVVAAALAAGPVRKLSFTGSTAVGSLLLERAARRVLDCSMELGGNAPFLVCDDADLDLTLDAALVAKMRNGGASCIAANRFIVADRLVDEFGRRLAQAMGSLRVGSGLAPGTDVGPLVSRRERDRVRDALSDAVAGGGTVRVGGTAPERPGWFYEPTVVQDLHADAPILAEEVFGPVASIVSVGSEEEMLSVANATEHGLAGYVCSQDLARALRLAEALEVGMVGINRGLISDPAAPFGGVKQSGLGREGGHHGILEFCETKYLAVAW